MQDQSPRSGGQSLYGARRSVLAGVLACSLCWPMATALAQSAPIDAAATPVGGDVKAKTEARAHFDRGVQLGHAGEYRQAAAEFQRAYQLAPHYAVLYNLAQVQIGLAQPVEAVDTLQRYLTEGGSNVPADRRAEVQATIKQEQIGRASCRERV